MPNFKKHKQLCYEWLILIITLYFIIIERNFLIPTFILGFIIGTNYITPDLDTGSTPYNRHKWLWFIYKKSSKHRGKSHNIILGVISKIIYLAMFLLVSTHIFGIILNDKTFFKIAIERYVELLTIYSIYVIYLIGGLFTSNTCHIIQDKFYKGNN